MARAPLTSIASLWGAGLTTGLATIPREPVLGLKRTLLPISYWRAAEFAYVTTHILGTSGTSVLDLGSPKDLALFLATYREYAVTAVDILEEAIAISRRYASARGRTGDGPGRVRSEVQDGRALPYLDNSFDHAYSVSVVEHIPENGDSLAVRELLRVVRPGGRVILTVPYDLAYRETFVDGPVYERDAESKNFFERHYDAATLRSRILNVAPCEIVNLEIWGEGRIRGERALTSLGKARTLLSPIEGLLASLLLRPVSSPTDIPMAAFVTLRKAA